MKVYLECPKMNCDGLMYPVEIHPSYTIYRCEKCGHTVKIYNPSIVDSFKQLIEIFKQLEEEEKSHV